MDKFDRIQQLHRIFTSHRLPVPIKTLGERLECTERTVHRLIETMQNILDAPIEYDRSRRGWHYVEDPENRFELPGLWLTGDELQSLSVLLNLLESLGNGLINEEIAPIEREIHQLLKARGISPGAFADQIRVLPVGNRQIPGRAFNRISEALLKKRRVEIGYTDFKGTKSERVISPQTLVHYRDNWYLDAWCHLREDLRTFSIARISRAEILKTKGLKIDRDRLLAHFADSYGIFAGKARHTARLRFSPAIAREIATQRWHPHQKGEWDGGDYLLSIPYSDDRELLQDLLRHTPHVYVESPVKLRRKLQNKLQQGLERNLGRGSGWL